MQLLYIFAANYFLISMYKKVLIALLFISSIAAAQHRQKSPPVLREISNQSIVLSVFPNAINVVKYDSYWFKIKDNSNKTLGFAMSSADFCKDVKGYGGITPVLIVTDKSFIIKKVALQSNYESPNYTSMLEKNGFFNSWVGNKITKANAVNVDGYTGATRTANAVRKHMDFLLTEGTKKLPKK